MPCRRLSLHTSMAAAESEMEVLQRDDSTSIVENGGQFPSLVMGSLLEVHDSEKNGSCRSLSTSPRKLKIVQTIILYSAVFDLALMGCMIGPSLLDLQMLTRSDTATIAMVFTGRGIGSFSGNILSGFILDKVNHWFLLTINKLIAALFTVLVPLCPNVPLLVLCVIPAGVMNGLADAACNCVVLIIWGKDNGPVMQGFHFLFGIGCMLAPIIVEPFLLTAGSTNSSETWLGTDNTSNSPLQGFSDGTESNNDSMLIYGFLIASCMSVVTGIAALVMFVRSDRVILTKKQASDNRNPNQRTAGKIPLGLWILFLGLLFLFYFSIVGLEMSLSGYLLTFSVKYLGWTKSHGAHVTSVFLGAFTIGRGMGIGIIKCVHPTVLLLGDLVICVAFSMILVIFVNMHGSVLWICAVGLGLGISTLFATGFTWTEIYIGVSPVAASVILGGAALGEISGPFIVGQLFDKLSMVSFVYILLAFAVLSLVMMLILIVTVKKVQIYFNQEIKAECIEVPSPT